MNVISSSSARILEPRQEEEEGLAEWRCYFLAADSEEHPASKRVLKTRGKSDGSRDEDDGTTND